MVRKVDVAEVTRHGDVEPGYARVTDALRPSAADPQAGLGCVHAIDRLGCGMPVERSEAALRATCCQAVGGPPQTIR